MKKTLICSAAVLISLAAAAKDRVTADPDAVNTGTIMHCWSWNFNEIASNMKNIADAGFTMLQTSPVQACYQPEGSGKKIFDEKEGNWYYYYQPTDWTVGNYILGTKSEMQAMLDSAAKYDIKVIVDVLPNHTAFDPDAVSEQFYKAVGGREKMYHSQGLTPISDYNNRMECTLMGVGGLPDVNTENPAFQKYYMKFVNELLGMGVRGFRYDTAKHIGVRSDPRDEAAGVRENDFWDVATGRKAVDGVKLSMPYDDLFVYGEVLQDESVPETEYAEYMGQTASNYGHVLREALEKHGVSDLDIKSWHHAASPEYLVTWVESHDTYANAHESAGLTDDQIRLGWTLITARQNGTPLFFSRPAGSSRTSYWGDNVLGKRGNDEFTHPEVKAVNKFRKAMAGEKEDMRISGNGEVVAVNRGKKGCAVINLGSHANFVNLPTGLPSGTYRDTVHNNEFKVKNGRLTGIAAAERSYILTK